VKPGQLIEAKILVKDKTVLASLDENKSYLMKQAKLSKVEFLDSIDKNIPAATAVVGSSEIFIPFAGMIDINAEKERLTKEIAKAEGEYEMLNKKLSNEGFVSRAPKDVVEKERARLAEVKSKLAKLKESLEKLA
jgi:valyl-tRNA synthetase